MTHDLSHVYWIGGSGCSGKSTIARTLEKDYGFTAYHCDDHWDDHLARSNPTEHPATFRIKSNPVKYLQLPPTEFDKESRAWFNEDFSLVLEDLHAMSDEKVVVEGVSLEPDFISEIAAPQQMIFIMSSKEFQRERFLKRDQQRKFFQSLPDPDRAFEDFIQNLAFQTEQLSKRVTDLGFKALITDENSTVSETLELVKKHFKL